MKIGSLTLDNPFILAPLAGYTNLPFRLLCREFGASLCFSEMISCHGMAYRQPNTLALLETVSEERPVAFQLFGADPDIMGKAAAMLSELPIDMIDINMGCPVKKVTKKGAGSALMKVPAIAGQIIESVRNNSQNIPVSIKIRSGWNDTNRNCEYFAKMAEDAGADLITVHGRTWAQGFSGTADWQMITKVKQVVSIPVIGNGDIHSYADGIRMMEETGCDGVMVGRAALGNPWVFSPDGQPKTLAGRLAGLQSFLHLAATHLNTDRKLAPIKNHAVRFFRDIPGSSAMRNLVFEAKSFADLIELATASSILEDIRIQSTSDDDG